MTKSMPYTRAVPFYRPAGRRRIEVFSPKIGRRLSLGDYDAYRGQLVGYLRMALGQAADLAQAHVNRLDGIGGVDDEPYLWRVVKERRDACPVAAP